jgi:hypothetical protein
MSRIYWSDDELLPLEAFQPRAGGGMRLYKKGGSAPNPNPGLIKQAESAERVGMRSLDLQEDYMNWSKGFYDDLRPYMEKLAQQQYDISESNRMRADEYADYERNTFRPLEQDLVRQAAEFNTDAKREELARTASADVSQAFGVARQQNDRDLMARGLSPDSGRFAALNTQLNLQEALARAGAQNNARTQAEGLGFARQMDAAALGRNLAPNASTAYGVSLQASNQAGNSYQQPGSYMSGAYGQGSNMLGQATNAYGTAGNIYGQEFNARMQGYNAQQQAEGAFWGGLGSAAGMIGSKLIPSSEEYKKDKKSIGKGKALEGINNLDVERWRYKTGFQDDREHIGPYAEDFKREFGVGSGKEIDLRDALGVTMKAVQDLTQEVRGLRKANGGSIHKGKGPVSGPGGPVDDKIPAMLSDGEYVLPADTTRKLGVKNLNRLVDETHTPAAIQRARRKRGLKGKKK